MTAPIWMLAAACGTALDVEFVDVTIDQAESLAARFCVPCRVRAECRTFADAQRPPVVGLWAATFRSDKGKTLTDFLDNQETA